MIHIQNQDWKDWTQVLIVDVDNYDSVKLCIPTDDNMTNVADACIYDLYVCDEYRRHGTATRLLKIAEEQAKTRGLKTVELKCNKNKAEKFVLEFYLKQGYEMYDGEYDEMHDENVCLMIKTLK